MLAVNQDSLGAAGTLVTQSDGLEVWSKTLADGSLAVGLFNRGDLEETVTADWSKLGITGRHAVRDLWLRKDLGRFSGKYAASVPSHGVVLLRLTMTRPSNLRAVHTVGAPRGKPEAEKIPPLRERNRGSTTVVPPDGCPSCHVWLSKYAGFNIL